VPTQLLDQSRAVCPPAGANSLALAEPRRCDFDVRAFGRLRHGEAGDNVDISEARATDAEGHPKGGVICQNVYSRAETPPWTASQILLYLRGTLITPRIPAPEPSRGRTPAYWIAAAMITITASVLLLRSVKATPVSFQSTESEALRQRLRTVSSYRGYSIMLKTAS
jgi:hypothetical protein